MVAQTSLHLDVESAQTDFSQEDAAPGRRTKLVWFLQGGALGLAALMLITLAAPFASYTSAAPSQHASAFNPAMPVFAPGIRPAISGMRPVVAQSSQRNPSTVVRMATEKKEAHEAQVKHAHTQKEDGSKHGAEFKAEKAKIKDKVKRTKVWEKEQAEKVQAKVEKVHAEKITDEAIERRRDAKEQLRQVPEEDGVSDEAEDVFAEEIEVEMTKQAKDIEANLAKTASTIALGLLQKKAAEIEGTVKEAEAKV